MKSITLALAISLVLGGCASGVQLDGPPVEDKAPTQPSGKPNTATGNSGNATGVAGGTNTGTSTGTGGTPSTNPGAAGSPTQVTTVSADDGFKPGQAPANVSKVIYFEVDSFQVKPDYLPVLESHAKWLKANRNRRAAIEGHTDSTGSNEYNLALGQRRADAVARALTLLGVTEPQLESVSFGEEKPVDPGNTEEAMAKNRRVEIFYR